MPKWLWKDSERIDLINPFILKTSATLLQASMSNYLSEKINHLHTEIKIPIYILYVLKTYYYLLIVSSWLKTRYSYQLINPYILVNERTEYLLLAGLLRMLCALPLHAQTWVSPVTSSKDTSRLIPGPRWLAVGGRPEHRQQTREPLNQHKKATRVQITNISEKPCRKSTRRSWATPSDTIKLITSKAASNWQEMASGRALPVPTYSECRRS